VVAQLGELRAILISVDKIMATVKRLNRTLNNGGDLREAQNELLEVCRLLRCFVDVDFCTPMRTHDYFCSGLGRQAAKGHYG